MLGAVAGGVYDAEADVADLDLRSVLERLEREPRLRSWVHGHGHVVLEREASVARDVIGMGVRLEDS
jgi:hypothetical protein